eukprot:g23596.t1
MAMQPLDYLYYSRHCYPRWEEVYGYKLGAIIQLLYPEYVQPQSSLYLFDLFDDERETLQNQLDHERDSPHPDQPEGRDRSLSVQHGGRVHEVSSEIARMSGHRGGHPRVIQSSAAAGTLLSNQLQVCLISDIHILQIFIFCDIMCAIANQ